MSQIGAGIEHQIYVDAIDENNRTFQKINNRLTQKNANTWDFISPEMVAQMKKLNTERTSEDRPLDIFTAYYMTKWYLVIRTMQFLTVQVKVSSSMKVRYGH